MPAPPEVWPPHRKDTGSSFIAEFVEADTGRITWRLVIREQRCPRRRELGQANWSGGFLVEQPCLRRRAAAHAERPNSNRTAEGALRHGDDIADANRVIGLSHTHPVDGDRSGSAEACGERAALGETREPEPLIEPPARRRG